MVVVYLCMSKVLIICKVCEKVFLARKYQIKIGAGLYCSTKCRAIGTNKKIPIEDRIWNYVEKRNKKECWIFTGYKNNDGYGKITSNGKIESAHRVVYRLTFGEIPEGKVVMHTCDNPACCNPRHLKLGTQNDNIQDMIKKGRHIVLSGEQASMFSRKQIKEIRKTYSGKRGQKLALSKRYKCSPTTITNILNGWKKT